MTPIIASLVEAFGELRVNKARIILALMGVAFSVFALTGVLGAGGMMKSAIEQVSERQNGRSTTIVIEVPDAPKPVEELKAMQDAVANVIKQYDIKHASRLIQYGQLKVQSPTGVRYIPARGIDPVYATIYRVQVSEGRWLNDSDSLRLAPVVAVNESAYDLLGRPELESQKIEVYNSTGKDTFTVVGVVEDGVSDYEPRIYYHASETYDVQSIKDIRNNTGFDFVVWVPPGLGYEFESELAARISSHTGFEAYANSNSWISESFEDTFGGLAKGILIVALVILILGAMGLLNIALVTIRYRVREIGIRRSYGATGLRIFVGVLMESVVATTVAGGIGVLLAIILLKSPMMLNLMRDIGLVEVPPLPVDSVIIGLSAAILVGFLAGVIPALIATRIKVIDAIRT